MTIADSLLANLNPQQAEAVAHHGTPLLIVAGAGSGKTRVITHRIAYLACAIGIPLWQILAVTFTNKAAKEMRERVCHLLGVPDDPTLAIGTFHSRCAAILRREAEAAGLERSFAILDERDQETAVKKAMEAAGVTDKKVRPGQALHFINLAKMKLLTADECREEFDADEIPYGTIYVKYEEILRKNNSLDFEDLIFRTVRLLQAKPDVLERWRHKFRYLLVDEFQDTNHSQFELVRLLAGESRQICVVGDEDQSIYSWRGADVGNLLDFQKAYPDAKIVKLEQNYRSVGNVLKAASAVIERNTMRIGKTLWTEEENGEPIRGISGVDDRDEAEQVARQIAGLTLQDGVPADQVAVFYRSHRLARAIEDGMRKYRMAYRIVGGTRFYDRSEIKDVLSFLRLAVQPTNDLAFERVVNVPTRGVGDKARGEILQLAALRGISQFEAARAMLKDGAFKGKAKAGMAEFIAAIEGWHAKAPTANASVLLKMVLDDTRYLTDGVGDANSLDGASRKENVEELVTVVDEFEAAEKDHTLGAFLEIMALDAQREEGDGRAKVSLMTVHNAKGLEFDHVFVIGLEQGVFPNSRTMDKPEQFEEERRLFYVALTRARKRLYLSRARRRMSSGFYEDQEPSLFLREVPEELMSEADRKALGLKGHGGGAPSAGGFPNRPYGNQTASSRPGLGSFAPRRPGAGAAKLTVGDRVTHTILGPGTITELGGRPGNERVYVEFDDGRSQEFVLRFAPLSRLA